MNRRWLASSLILTLALLGACATPRVVYTPTELQQEAATRLGAARAAQLRVPFAIGPALKQSAERIVMAEPGGAARLRALAAALSDPEGFGLRYDRDLTGGAEETVARGGGDCLSLTSAFVGLARAVGLEVVFVDARGVQEFSDEGALVVERRHVVAGYGEPTRFTVVDFDRVATPVVQYRILSDIQAVAHYYNNLGYLHLRAGENAAALESFETAVLLDPQFAAGHNNFAVALARSERVAEAEDHLATAIRLDSTYSPALVNLSQLYRRTGRAQDADALHAAAGALRLRDPLWRLKAGLDALARQDVQQAVESLRAAVRLDKRLFAAWLGLARAYDRRGERRRAARAVARALELDPNNAEARDLAERLRAPTSTN